MGIDADGDGAEDGDGSEGGAPAKGGQDWAADGEGQEEEESEEARKARIAEYEAAKAEEDAIKQV